MSMVPTYLHAFWPDYVTNDRGVSQGYEQKVCIPHSSTYSLTCQKCDEQAGKKEARATKP